MPFAVVTGASGGLGLKIAEKLADAKYDLLLIARTESRLRELATQLASRGVRVEVCAADLATEEGLARAEAAALAQPVDVLINNAGFGNYGRFWELDPKSEQEVVRLNIQAVVQLSHAVMPSMIKRGKGCVINVASTAGFQAVPYFSVYAATKAFIISFSEAVSAELRGQGVRGVQIMAVCPGPMETGFQSRAGASKSTYGFFPWETADEVARKIVRIIGSERSLWIPAFFNRVLAFLNAFTPRTMGNTTLEKIFRPRGESKKREPV